MLKKIFLIFTFLLTFSSLAFASPYIGTRGVSKKLVFQLYDKADPTNPVTGATCASGDVQISKDEGSYSNTTNCFTEIGLGFYYVTLTTGEMGADRISVSVKDQTGPEVWMAAGYVIETIDPALTNGELKLYADIVKVSGDSNAADNLELDYDGTGYNKSNSTIGTATSLTNKTGFSLTQTFPTNFADLAITSSTGRVTVGTNADKTGYSLTQTFPANFSSLAITSSTGKVTVGTNDDKTDYSLADGSITSAKFGSGAIDATAFGQGAADKVWSTTSRVLTANTNLSIPSAANIADAVWDEAQSGHTTSGTFGKYLDAAISGVSTGGVSVEDIADAVWDEALAGHTTTGSSGKLLSQSINDVLDCSVNSNE